MDNKFISKVFKYFGIGLIITFLTAYIVSINENIINIVYQTPTLIILCILEIGLAIFLPLRINKMTKTTAKTLYYTYTILTGLTLSSIFLIYKITSIIYIFLASAIIFIIFSIIGKNIKIDLSKFTTFLLFSLLTVIILEIINIFLLNNTLDITLCIISIIIFMAYIAYDIQIIIKMNDYTNTENYAIIGAFNLYLDFINIFIKLLRLFAEEK